MNLFPHNQKAYEAVIQHLESHNKAAIVHATGTGKSFIIAKLAEHFYPTAIVIAPNNFVLNETRKLCPDWVEFRTYASVMCEKDFRTDYNAIFLDEFHRAGAEEWSKGVQRLIEANSTAKLIGTSATHIRYLDNARNMADELFDGNIVSQITLGEAIENNILPNPTYVSSLYEIEETERNYTERIKKSRLNDEEQDKILKQLRTISRNWEQSSGVPSIIKKYFGKDMQRIIVFCSKVEKAKQLRSLVASWLSKAGYKNVRYYNIDYKEKFLEREMNDFQEPLGKYDLKVAISVNMLNEGVHIPRVDGIIMLRGTISRIIIEQQIGRCLTADARRIPVILDLVNNMDTIRYDWQGFYQEESVQSPSSTNKKDVKEKLPFHIIDEIRDLRIFFNQIDKKICGRRTKDECHEVALRYQLKSEFYKHDMAVYRYAYYHGWLDEITSHMPKTEINYYSREELRESVLSLSKLPKEKKYRSVLVNYIRNVVRQGEDSAVIEHAINNNLYILTREEKLKQYKSLLKDYVVKNKNFPRTHMEVDGKRIPEITFYNYVLDKCPQYIEELSSKYNIAKNGEVYDERFRQNVEFIRKIGYKNLDYNISKHDSMLGWILKQKHRWNRLKQWQRDELLSIGITSEIVTSTQKSIDKAKEYVAWVKKHGDFPPSNNQLYYWHKNVFDRKDINPDIIEILKEVGADNKYCKMHKIYSIDERVSILERWAKGEDVGYNIQTLMSWKRKIYKSEDTALIERLENAGIKVKSIGDTLIDENLQELEKLLKSGVKLLRKINGGIERTVCKTICEGSDGDKRRQVFIDMLNRYGARIYTKEGEWWDNFNLCRSLMSRTGFYPRSRFQEEKKCHEWLKNQVSSKYWEKLTPYIEKHNMILPDERGVYRPNFAWSDPLPNENYSHLGNKAW